MNYTRVFQPKKFTIELLHLLKKKKSYLASKYKLKKAIYELGPTGFPFERFIVHFKIFRLQNRIW